MAGSLAPKHEREDAQAQWRRSPRIEREKPVVVPGDAEDGGKIDFEELLGDGPRALE